MKKLQTLLVAFILIMQNSYSQTHLKVKKSNIKKSPLSEFSTKWDDIFFYKCNTAENTNYLSLEERNIIFIINLVRTNPAAFANTVLLNPVSSFFKKAESRNSYENSLIETLIKMKPYGQLLYPDSVLYKFAKCHAINSGIRGYVGHDRKVTDCATDSHFAECCSYGESKAIEILLLLLIDKNIIGLGHRLVILDLDYSRIGVSIQPHINYEFNAVLDFKNDSQF